MPVAPAPQSSRCFAAEPAITMPCSGMDCQRDCATAFGRVAAAVADRALHRHRACTCAANGVQRVDVTDAGCALDTEPAKCRDWSSSGPSLHEYACIRSTRRCGAHALTHEPLPATLNCRPTVANPRHGQRPPTGDKYWIEYGCQTED